MLKTIFEDKLFESILDLGIELLIWFIFLFFSFPNVIKVLTLIFKNQATVLVAKNFACLQYSLDIMYDSLDPDFIAGFFPYKKRLKL